MPLLFGYQKLEPRPSPSLLCFHNRQADMLVVENLPFEQQGFPTLLYAERLMARIFLHLKEPLPATVFMHSHMLVTGNEQQNEKNLVDCVHRRKGRDECAQECESRGSFKDRPAPWNETVLGEAEMDRCARHYGFATFSQVNKCVSSSEFK